MTRLPRQHLSNNGWVVVSVLRVFRLAVSSLHFNSLAMEAKSMLSGVCSNTTIASSIQNPKKLPILALVQDSVSLRTHKFLAPQRVWSYRRLVCINSAEKVKNVVASKEKDSKSGSKKKKLAVFVSGGGSNFRSIHAACVGGSVHGVVVVLVTNKHGCGGAEYARDNNIPVILFPQSKDEPNGLSPSDLVALLRKFEVDFILLAGYLKLLPVELIRAYPRSMVNIHPSLLPSFGGKGYYGMNVHKAVIASGARYSGPTIHYVDEHYDTGCILAQRVVPVLWNDTAEDLAARVLQEEHRLYVDVVEALCEERVIWREDGVPLIQTKENPSEYI